MSTFNKKRKIQHSDSDDMHKKKQKNAPVLSSTTEMKNVIAKAVNIGTFAENRAIEIQALTMAVKDVGGNHLAFQKLPRHMRRRAMSHNIKRVPRRLHEQVRAELDKVKAPIKRPSRRFRRKPSSLLSEYERRRRRISWLETHIWHAKRFKMVEKWGYRLPLHPNEKSIRACYRAVRRYCLLQDVSYESYFELKGDRECIVKGLKHLTSEETGLTFAACLTSRGTRQGSLVLYCYDNYPYQAIGNVTYLWRSQINNSDKDKHNATLWLCCQPAFQAIVMKELKKCFPSGLVANNSTAEKFPDSSVESVKNEDNVVISSLKDHLVKFRLFGPMSNLVIRKTFKLWDFEHFSSESKRSETDERENGIPEFDDKVAIWWKTYYKQELNCKVNKLQREAWEAAMACQTPNEVPPNAVMSAVVRDPRLRLPSKQEKVYPSKKDSVMRKLPKELFNAIEVSNSPLWEESIRNNVKVTKILEKDLNRMKSKHLIPGTPLELGEKESKIPILLIQRPGFSHLHSLSSTSLSSTSPVQEGYSSGWDIILPSGWAMAFWIALVYRGARVGGLREAHSISLQARQLNQIKDVPDSEAGKSELMAEGEAMQVRHDRRPPAKRPNYTKLGFDPPFTFRFQHLCEQWLDILPKLRDEHSKEFLLKDLPSKKDTYVLRNKRILQLLNLPLTNMKSFVCTGSPNVAGQSRKQQKKAGVNPITKLLSNEKGKKVIDENQMALVPVCVSVLSRGVPVPFAHICQPSKEDMKMLARDKCYGGPVEALHPDLDAPRRKKERKERLSQRRKRKQGKKIHAKDSNAAAASDVSTSTSPLKQTDQLDVKPKQEHETDETSDKSNTTLPSLLSYTSRPIIGFVTKGDFNLRQGQGSGMGFCSVAALLHIIAEQGKQKHCTILVRNPTSTQYRFATISVVL